MYVKKDDIKPFDKKVWLASPTMHGDELKYITDAYETNWMSTVGANINEANYGQSKADFNAKLNIALKEANETYYWLRLLHQTDYLTDKEFKSMETDIDEIIAILVSICKKTNQK